MGTKGDSAKVGPEEDVVVGPGSSGASAGGPASSSASASGESRTPESPKTQSPFAQLPRNHWVIYKRGNEEKWIIELRRNFQAKDKQQCTQKAHPRTKFLAHTETYVVWSRSNQPSTFLGFFESAFGDGP